MYKNIIKRDGDSAIFGLELELTLKRLNAHNDHWKKAGGNMCVNLIFVVVGTNSDYLAW